MDASTQNFDPVRDIADFHNKFGLVYDGDPRHLPEDMAAFRVKFMAEELCEYAGVPDALRHTIQDHLAIANAGAHVDLEKKFDALIDLAYVLLGTAYLHGFHRFREGWNRVHAANMQKQRVDRLDDSTRKSVYDVIKPKGWTPPVLADLVEPSGV